MTRTVVVVLLTLALIASVASAQSFTWRFDTDGDLEAWTPANFETSEVTGGAFRGLTAFDCQLLSPPLGIDAAEWPILEFRATSSLTSGGEVFFQAEGAGFTDDTKSRHTLTASGEPRLYRIDMSAQPDWQGVIDRIRLDLINPAGVEVTVDHIRFLRGQPGVAPNPSFEHDFDGDGMPDGWRIDAAESAWSTENPTDGDRTLMLATSAANREAQLSARVPLDLLGVFALDATVAAAQNCGPRAIHASLTFFDLFGAPLPGDPLIIPAGQPDELGRMHIASDFDSPRLAASADLRITLTGKGARVWLDQIRLAHDHEPLESAERPLNTWRSDWIWAEETFGQDETGAHFRYAVDLPANTAGITDARCQLTADDAYELFLNGVSIALADDADGWRTPEVIDLQPHLVPGRNVFAISAVDHSSAEGLILEAVISWPRRDVEIFSGADWRAVGEQAPEGWTQPDFDDTAWPAAKVVAAAGGSPWGDLPYEFMGHSDVLSLVSCDIPDSIDVGDTLTVTAIIDRLPASASDYPVRFGLNRDGGEMLHTGYALPGVHRTTAEGEVLGPLSLPTSRFMPPGDYEVTLGFPRSSYDGHEGVVVGTVKLRPPSQPEYPPKVEIKRYNGLPTLFINDHPNPFMHYIELRNSPVRIGNMRDAGCHIYQIDAYEFGWKGPGQFDYTEFDARVLELLSYDPDAWIMPSFMLSGRHQTWWKTEHPEELAATESGSTDVMIYHGAGKAISLASQLWREASGDAMRKFVAHCQSAPYATRIIGYHPASGVSWEWQHWASINRSYEPTDYSEPMRSEFSKWVARKYGDDIDAVRAAWKMPEVTFDTVAIPSVAVRDAADHMLFRVPSENRYIIDFYTFYQDVMVDGILHYFGIIKEATGGAGIVGTYYGYTATMLGGARRAGDSGHYALHRLLESDLCDFLVSPFDYSSRAVGETYQIMSAVGSVLAHDKLWVMQADLRTHLVDRPEQRVHGAPDGLDGTVSQLQRAFASCTAKGLATQWYDFSNGWIARDPRQSQAINILREIGDRWLTWDRSPDPEGIAVILDEGTPSAYLSHDIEAMFWLVYKQKIVFERVGVPWNIYLLDDVLEGRVPKSRCYFFLNCFHMTDAERDYINSELKSDGRTIVWNYAPGYIGNDDLDIARVSELTGMEMTEVDEMRPWKLDLSEDHPLTEGLTALDISQPRIEIGPVFYAGGDGIEIAGTWSDSDWPGLAIRRFDDWTSIYSATPLLSPKLIKRIAADAGVPVRVESTNPSYVSRNFIGVHSASESTETLHFPEPMRVTDLVTGEILAADATELQITVPGPGTRLLHTAPAQ